MSELRGKRILVTGATGLVGFPLCGALAADNEVFAAAYAFRGGEPMGEDGPYGLHGPGLEAYSLSKISAESLLQFASREWQVPTVILRCFTMYGPRGGSIAARIGQIRAGIPIQLYPGVPNL